MDLTTELLRDHSRENADRIIEWVGNDATRMSALMDCFLYGTYRVGQRAAWPISIIARQQPQLLAPFLPLMVKNLDNAVHDAVVRNTVRVFQDIDVPESLEGPLYEKCFSYLIDLKQATAIRCFSMSVLAKIAHRFPELREELIATIEEYGSHGSKGIQARARRVLHQLRRAE